MSCAVARKPSIRDCGNGQGCEERYCTTLELDADLLEDLAAQRLLQRLAGLHEARERRVHAGRKPRRAAEQAALAELGWAWVTSTITAGSVRGKCCAAAARAAAGVAGLDR